MTNNLTDKIRAVQCGWQPIETADKSKGVYGDGVHEYIVKNGQEGGYSTEPDQVGVARFGTGGFQSEHWYSTVCCDGVSYFKPTHFAPLDTPDKAKVMQDIAADGVELIAEYAHWRKVNPHIKGGENYVKRMEELLVTIEKMTEEL